MLVFILFSLFLAHVGSNKASTKSGDSLSLQVPPGLDVFDDKARPESCPPLARRQKFTRCRLGSTHSTTAGEAKKSSDDDYDIWYINPSCRGSQDGYINPLFCTTPSPINKSPTPEVVAAQELCLRRLKALTDQAPAGLNAPTLYTEYFILKESSLENLAFIADELKAAYTARQTARELRTKTKPLKFVHFNKTISSVASKKLWDLGEDYYENRADHTTFQTSIERIKANVLGAPHAALACFYLQQSDILLPEDLMQLIVYLMKDDEQTDARKKILNVIDLEHITTRLKELIIEAKRTKPE